MKKNKHPASQKSSDKTAAVSPARPELELGQGRFKLTQLDYLLAPLFAAVAGVWAFPYVGTAMNWDDLEYMNLSQYTVPNAFRLNRYGHIYLQKFFFWLTGDAITGGRVFWCLLFLATCVLIYWCAKILAGKRGYIIGIIAVLFFCMQQVFKREVGSTLADFTVMFLIALGTFVYLAFLTPGHKHRYLVIMILGLIFYWVVKSKETGICMAVLFLGLGEDETGSRSIGRFLKDVGWACMGVLAGLVLLMVLDQAFMSDALFSIRPSNWAELLHRNIHRPRVSYKGFYASRVIMSWYTGFSTHPQLVYLFAPFLFYLLVGWKSPGRRFSSREKITWLFPLVFLLFISFIRAHFWVIPRYFTPAMPVICIWAAQFFWFDVSGPLLRGGSKPRIPKALVASVLVLAAFIIAYICMLSLVPRFIEYCKRKPDVFYMVAIMPFSTMVLLMVAGVLRKRGLIALFLSFFCLFLLMYYPLKTNFTSLKQRVRAERSELRYAPYRAFADELRFGKDVKIVVSKDIHDRSWMLGRKQKSHCWMFNIFFNQKFERDQFIKGTQDDILKGDYTYAFMTWRDWKGIQEKHNVDHLLRNYILKVDRKTQTILLKKR